MNEDSYSLDRHQSWQHPIYPSAEQTLNVQKSTYFEQGGTHKCPHSRNPILP